MIYASSFCYTNVYSSYGLQSPITSLSARDVFVGVGEWVEK